MGDFEAFCIIGGGLLSAYYMFKLCGNARGKQENLGLWIGCTLGAAICLGLGGMLSMDRIAHSDRPHISGTIQELHEYSGSHGTKRHTLTVRTSDGQDILLDVLYYGKHLREGQQVAITYLASHRSVLEIISLTPPDIGWTEEEGDGMLSSKASTAVGSGFAIACLALLTLRNRSTQSPRSFVSHR